MTVEIVAAAGADDAAFVTRMTELVNRVYADAEKGLWRDGVQRTDRAEIAAMIRAGQLAVARRNGGVVGAVRVRRLDRELGELGMLVADPDHRGAGVGRALVAFAEDWARRRGLTRMQLELLVPQTWTHPVKEFVRGWYTRIGYRQVGTGQFADSHPALHSRLAAPCDFLIFHKEL